MPGTRRTAFSPHSEPPPWVGKLWDANEHMSKFSPCSPCHHVHVEGGLFLDGPSLCCLREVTPDLHPVFCALVG